MAGWRLKRLVLRLVMANHDSHCIYSVRLGPNLTDFNGYSFTWISQIVIDFIIIMTKIIGNVIGKGKLHTSKFSSKRWLVGVSTEWRVLNSTES